MYADDYFESSAPEKHVLVVDDDPDVLDLIRNHLQVHGIAIRTAADGSEALDKIAEKSPALIVLDLAMPGINGFEFVSRMRVQPSLRRIPVIVLTSLSLDIHDIAKLLGGVSLIVPKNRLDLFRRDALPAIARAIVADEAVAWGKLRRAFMLVQDRNRN